MSDLTDIRIEAQVGRISLTRPSALHALNQEMCSSILDALIDWKSNPNVKIVIVDHQSDTRGFCAGGDIRMLRDSGAGDSSEARDFFKTEYRMNAAIKSFPKPYLSIMDGVTMGGGVGLSVHGSHRVATERTLFAMPETGIGLFPDVGGGWFLPRLEGELGVWLALTGARLKGADVVASGVATHLINSEKIAVLNRAISGADFSVDAATRLDEILRPLNEPAGDGSFAPHMSEMSRLFEGDCAETIEMRLLASATLWATDQLKVLAGKSPETVKVALRQLREGAVCETFEDNMKIEYRIGWRKVSSHDFQEGVRAVIVDKDNAPNWSPQRLAQVSDADVAKYFEPLGEHELTF